TPAGCTRSSSGPARSWSRRRAARARSSSMTAPTLRSAWRSGRLRRSSTASTEARASTTSEPGSEIRELYEIEEERKMKNPMWFVEKQLAKVKMGTRAIERELVRSAEALGDNVGLDAKFAAEVFRQVIHRLILVLIEAGLVSLVRQLMTSPATTRIYPLH